MKLSKEASRLFAEYLRAEEACEEPNYLQPNKLDDTFGAIRRISAAADEIFGQVVGKILAERQLKRHTSVYQRCLFQIISQ